MDDNMMDLLFVSDDGSTYGFDTNGDGLVDCYQEMGYDENGNAVLYTSSDTNGDGLIDAYSVESDTNGDGMTDILEVGRDYDQDGTPDNIKLFMDTNGSGDFDTVANLHADTETPDVAYRVETDVDIDGDHVSDIHQEDIIPADDAFADYSYSESYIGSPAADGTFDPETPSELVAGEPARDMEVWECQGQTNRCALYSQKFVIEQLTGDEIDIEEFADIAEENGWFTEETGTTDLNMNKMLEYYGIDHEVSYDADMEDLETALRNGDKVIVSVDANQFWKGTDNDIFSPMTRANHALEVIGIDYSDPSQPMVILNDSGTPAGCGEMVPLDTFEEAWSTGDHQMIVCRA